ncbi:MAG: mechanosensitive ion channel family protein [bacterium]
MENLFMTIMPLAVFVVTLTLGYIARQVIFRRLSAWAKGTKSEVDNIIIGAIRCPCVIWCLMLAVYLALEFSKLSDEEVFVTRKILLLLGIMSVTIALVNITTRLIKHYSKKVEVALPVGLTQNISRIIILTIGILIALNSLGISIAPILAALGVGGLTVALALQDTLSNLFAGFYVSASRNIRVGDFIKIDTGEEGYVEDIGWRVTKVRMLPNNVVLIPNNKLSQAVITNYYLPDKELAVLVQVGVHYNSDLKKVEEVTIEVAREVMKGVLGGVASFEPFIRYHTFGDSSINFTVILRAKEFVDNYLIKHEFIKKLHERYAQEGIVIPYPIRAINYEQEKTR